MNISLDNINFYSQPSPAKSLPRAVPVSCWRPYETPLAPRALSHAPPPRLPSPRTTITIASDARSDAPPRFLSPVRQDPDLRAVRNEFDVEIERIAMVENGRVMHEADLDIRRNSGLRNGNVTDVPQSQHTSLATEHLDQCPFGEAVTDSDPAFIPAEAASDPSGPPVAPTDRLQLHRDSAPPSGTYDEADKDLTPPEVRFPCARALPPPSPDLLGTQHSESIVDDTKAAPESCGDQAGEQRDVVTTIQSIQINRPSVGDASLDNDERGRLAKESQVPTFSRRRQRTRPVKQSIVTLASTRSLRPRPNAESTRPERLPAVSVVISTRRADQLAASTKTSPPTRARRYGDRRHSDSGSLNNDRPTLTLTGEFSPSSGGSNPRARGRPRKRPKRAIENMSASTNDIVRKCTGHSQTPLDGGLAVTPGETQEIFGRGVLRIQAHGPRHAYFMTFLPDVPHRPSLPSPPPDQSSYPENFSETASSQKVACKGGRKRTVSTASEDEDVWSTRHSTNSPRNLRSQNDRNKAQRKTKGRQRWCSEEVDLLLQLRRDEQRPWSEVVKLFSDRYPGRSSGSIQVYWSTTLKRAQQDRIRPATAAATATA